MNTAYYVYYITIFLKFIKFKKLLLYDFTHPFVYAA